MSIFFSPAISRAFSDAAHARFWCEDPKLSLLDFLKMLVLALSQIYARVFHLWIIYRSGMCLGRRFSPGSVFSSLFLHYQCGTLALFVSGSQTMLTGLSKDASFGPPPNLHTCISLAEFYRIGQCLGWRFSPMSVFFSPACFPAFSDAENSRF